VFYPSLRIGRAGARGRRVRYNQCVTGAATDYLRKVAAALADGYPDDCVTHACRLAELLVADGEWPWIGRLRDVTKAGYGVHHGPLRPKVLAGRNGPTWTTHYVACTGDRVYDPLAGAPIALAVYAETVFGREIPLETFLDANATAELCRLGQLHSAFLPSAPTEAKHFV
jgi:hypothetical protein